ncbi:MAG TPA: GFA family protein [Casimicrobiaceae bacterium]|jgi:hypothetical protein
MNASSSTEARGSCHCGSVQFVARFPSRFCSHCHCESCRRAHSAAFVTWIGFKSDQVDVVVGAEHLARHESSPRTFRSFCAKCGTKVMFESDRWPGERHIPLAAITTAVDRVPANHYCYEEHVAWIPWPETVPS